MGCMRAKFIGLLCGLCLTASALGAGPTQYGFGPTWKEALPDPYVEAKAGYFLFASKAVRHVFNHGGIDLQLSGAYPLIPSVRLYGSVEYMKKSGHGSQKPSFWAVPFSLGLQPVVSICSWHPIFAYMTIGPRYFLTRVHRRGIGTIHSNGWGGFANVGFMLQLYRNLTLDLFGEGSYARLHYSPPLIHSDSDKAQIGAITFGSGLAYTF
jgi:hypothetical protein